MEVDQETLSKARHERDMAAARIVGVVGALMQMGRLDGVLEALPHTYSDLGSFILQHTLAEDAIRNAFNLEQVTQ